MTTEYIKKQIKIIPRIPLEGNIDITYRCNNKCLHCWIRTEADYKEQELSFEEITHIVDEARKTGCRQWSISGGEPMLREDFTEIFDYITRNCRTYSINTNGTLITPEIACLMKRKGNKMIALYGASQKVHDHITGKPGSFEATMRGFSYLKEAGAGFTVQLVLMRDNYHEFKDMIKLADSLSPYYRIGASWLYLTRCRDKERNKEIIKQRLSPEEVIKLDEPDIFYEENYKKNGDCQILQDDFLFASCIGNRKDFHIDPYGKMSFCCYVVEPSMRYDLKNGTFEDCWENFIPSLWNKVQGGEEYRKNCGSCELRESCKWCPVYGYLEHGRYSAKVKYLCEVARENQKFKEEWMKNNRRYYRCADITIQVDSELPINKDTFHAKIKAFEVNGPGKENIFIKHHFYLPDIKEKDLEKEYYRKPPWAIYKKGGNWIYLGISNIEGDNSLRQVAVFNNDYTRGNIYNPNKEMFYCMKNSGSIAFFPSDQLLLARVMANRNGFYLHSAGVILDKKGLLFAGPSTAGKSTMVKMLKGRAEILCDDRIIIRRWSEGFKIYGTWSHGEVPDVSPNSAPLRVIFFLEKSKENKIIPLKDKKEITKRLLLNLIRPFVTVDWWEKTLTVLEKASLEVPCYILKFDKSGKIIKLLEEL